MLIPKSQPVIITEDTVIEKHLAGKHDQSFHAGGGKAAAYRKLAVQRKKMMDSGKTRLGIKKDSKGRVINPEATGGYKANIPEVINMTKGGGFEAGPLRKDSLTPDHSLWHHLESDGNGGYRVTAERQAVHNKIVEDAVNPIPISGDPTFTMLGGGPASGKSSAIKTGAVQVPDKTQAVHINADDVKSELPEFERMRMSSENSDFFGAAEFAHEESSMVAKKIQTASLENKRDVVLDGTGDSDIDKLSEKVGEARAYGYKVNGEYITIPTQVAVSRANARSLNSNERRFVPASVVTDTHSAVSNTFVKAAESGLFDKINLWDNNQQLGQPPTLVGTGNSQGFSIANQALYDEFVAKGTR